MALIQTLHKVEAEKLPRVNDVSDARGADSHLYVIQEVGGPIKIGVAVHVARRMAALQVGNPRELWVSAAYLGPRNHCIEVERLVLSNCRRVRGEWISANLDSVLAMIESWRPS